MINTPKLKRDWVGLRVRLKNPTENRGGGIFPAGTEFLVDGYYRGLTLKREEACDKCRCRGWSSISRVNINSVEIVQENSVQLIEDLEKESRVRGQPEYLAIFDDLSDFGDLRNK